MPAPTFTNLTGSGASSATSFSTASVSPTGNRLILVTIHAYISTGAAQPAQPSVTDNGITYDLVRAQDVDAAGTDRATLFTFRGMAASPSAGAITIDFGAVTMTRCQWSVDQSDANVDTTGTNGSGAIVQTTGVTTASNSTSGSVNYASAMTAGNSGFSAWGHQVQEAKTPRASWTELADVTTVTLASVETQYIAGTDTAGSASWTTGSRAGGIIVEIAAGSSGTTVSPTGIASEEAFGTATVTAALTVSPTGIGSTEAFGTPTITATLTVSPGGIASAEAIGTLTVLTGGAVAPDGIASAEDFGTPTAVTTLTVAPTGVTSAEAFGAVTVATTLTASPGGIPTAEAVGSPAIAATLTVTPAGVVSGEAFGTPAITTTLTVSPAGIASAEAFGTLTISTVPLRDITVIANIRSNHVTGGVRLTDLVTAVRASHITGGIDVSRTLRTGSVEYVVAEVTFVGETAAGIATATGQVQITTSDTTPTAADPNWVNPDVTTRTDVTGGAKLALSKLHTAGAAGTYRLWAKVTDNPEVPILLCGSFDVRS